MSLQALCLLPRADARLCESFILRNCASRVRMRECIKLGMCIVTVCVCVISMIDFPFEDINEKGMGMRDRLELE